MRMCTNRRLYCTLPIQAKLISWSLMGDPKDIYAGFMEKKKEKSIRIRI